MRRALIAVFAVGTLAWLVFAVIPWATKERTVFTSTPSVRPFDRIAPVVLRPGQQACLDEVAVPRHTRLVSMYSDRIPRTGRGPRLNVTLAGRGYRAQAIVPAGYAQTSPLTAVIPDPRTSVLTTLCVANAGHRPVSLLGSAEKRTASRTATVIDGVRSHARLRVSLAEKEPASIADRPREVLHHAAAFKPWFAGWLGFALLGLAVLVAVPFGAWYALDRALRDDARL